MADTNQQAAGTPLAQRPSEVSLTIGSQTLKAFEQAGKLILKKNKQGVWESMEIATLGESDLFVIRTANGSAKLFWKKVRLTEKDKEIINIGYGDKPNWLVTIAGYDKLNQIAAITLVTPQQLVGDRPVSNPYIEYVDGEAKRIIARKIAIGPAPTGQLVAIDSVRYYNLDAYYLQDLMAKAKGKPMAGQMGIKFVCPFCPDEKVIHQDGVTYARQGKMIYIFKRIKDAEGLWIDSSHEEINKCYNQHISHQKFGDVTAQKLAGRNALKAHPAIATSAISVVAGVAEVMVYSYRHDMDKAKLDELGERIARGEQLDNVKVTRDEGEATFEEVASTATEESDDERPEAPPMESAPTSAPSPKPDPTNAPGAAKTITREPVNESQVESHLFGDTGIPLKQQMKTVHDRIAVLEKEKSINIDKLVKMVFADTRRANLTPDQLSRLLTMMESIPTPADTTVTP